MHFIVYETTNLISGKKYIGVHKTEDYRKFDGYFGSGTLLKNAIRKYGRCNFKRRTIVVCPTEQYALDIEAKLVDETVVGSSNYYNMVMCGNKPPILSGVTHPNYGGMSDVSKQRMKENHWSKRMGNTWFTGHTMESRSKLSEARKKTISVDGVVYNSLQEAAASIGVWLTTIRKWRLSGRHNVIYIESGD